MKIFTSVTILIIIFGFSPFSSAQFDNLGKKIKKKVERKIEREVDQTIDDGLNETEKAIKNKNEKNDQSVEDADRTGEVISPEDSGTESGKEEIKNEENLKIWSGYDFIPGDRAIFHDDLAGEEYGEFPSRWDLISGSAEVASLGDENVIHFANSKTIILPLMDKKDFLPDVFTIEFDVYFEELAPRRSQVYTVRFYDGTSGWTKIDGKRVYPVDIRWNEVRMDKFGGKTSDFNEEKNNWKGKWKHVAISFNQRSLKVYLDQERLINIPNLGYKPQMFSVEGSFDARYIKATSVKNIRVNEGGKSLYDRVMTDGKFVTTGILFDVNKSTIKTESMGTINEIVKLMKQYPDLNFRIEGHTDSDGSESKNQKLSEERASAVRNLLIQSGIDASRLDSKGFGESRPVDSNTTLEGKANNRRVEFIKL